MPGTGFVELALAAGQVVGSEAIEELALYAPLLLADGGAIQLQITVSAVDAEGHRELSISTSSPQLASEDAAGRGSGLAMQQACSARVRRFQSPRRSDSGIRGRPPKRTSSTASSSTTAWRRRAMATVPPSRDCAACLRWTTSCSPSRVGCRACERKPESFCVHPALSDCALHAALLRAGQPGRWESPSRSLVCVCSHAAPAQRMCIWPEYAHDPQTMTLLAVDEQGAPVFSIAALQTRAIDQSQLSVARGQAW